MIGDKMQRKIKKSIKKIENETGFDIVNIEEITDYKSLIRVVKQHLKWIQDHAAESAQRSEKILRNEIHPNYFFD